MAIVDPEQHAAGMAALEASYRELENAPGEKGALSRSFPVAKAFHIWVRGEIERGTSAEDIHQAGCRFLGTLVGSLVFATSAKGANGYVLASALCAIANVAAQSMNASAGMTAEIHEGTRQ